MSEAEPIPWQVVGALVAATIAAVSSIAGVVINTLVATNKHRHDALVHIANRRFEWAKELRTSAAEYVAAVYDLVLAHSEKDAQRTANAHSKMFCEIHRTMLLLKAEDSKRVEGWHDETMKLIGSGQYTAAAQRIARFVDIISIVAAPEILKAERELQGYRK